MRKEIHDKRTGESYISVDHPSGLKILLYPMRGFSSAYALFATKYGSVDATFKTGNDDDFVTVPDGVAHFLEHKMFDTKDGDVFGRFAALGASANAYTSFDRTAYLFSCTENFAQSLEVLLDFVQNPHFTPEKVEKEQGIIGQEIQMYDDDGDWRVFFNLLGALYQKHPVAIDIAGTVESIAKIDDKLLYRCYNTFYNLNNMVLVVAGNFDCDEALAVADKVLKKAEPISITRRQEPEPKDVNKPRVEQTLEVAMPLFQIGFKGEPAGVARSVADSLRCEMLMEIIAGEASPLYRELYDAGLINQAFGTEVQMGESFFNVVVSGESREPDAVYAKLIEAVAKLRAEGVSQEDFELARRILYGRHLGYFGNVRAIATMLLQSHMTDVDAYEHLEMISSTKLEDLAPLIERYLDPGCAAISIVWPKSGGNAS